VSEMTIEHESVTQWGVEACAGTDFQQRSLDGVHCVGEHEVAENRTGVEVATTTLTQVGLAARSRPPMVVVGRRISFSVWGAAGGKVPPRTWTARRRASGRGVSTGVDEAVASATAVQGLSIMLPSVVRCGAVLGSGVSMRVLGASRFRGGAVACPPCGEGWRLGFVGGKVCWVVCAGLALSMKDGAVSKSVSHPLGWSKSGARLRVQRR
jgi:hypothetical protein